MKLTAKDLYNLKVIDKIIKETEDNEEGTFLDIANNLQKEITKSIKELKKMSKEQIVENRYQKFRNIGEYIRR